MNRKQLTILIVLVAVIGGAALFLLNKRNSSFVSTGQNLGQKLFPKLPVNDVAQIRIAESGAELNLVKADDIWRVKERNNYPANFSQISDFLVKASNLKIAQTEEIGASQLARLELLEPSKGSGSGTLVDLKDKSGKAIESVVLGKKHMQKSAQPSQFGPDGYPDGRYVLLPNDSKNVLLISDPLSDVEPKPENWLNKNFFKIEKVKSISLVSTNATNSWKLSRTNESSEWVLAEVKTGEELDTNKVSGVANSLASPGFIDVVVNAKPDELGLDEPLVATLETFDNFTYTLKIGKLSGDNYPLTMAVNANLPKERTAGAEEKPEDKAKLDKEFADKTKALEEKLQKEKAFEKWTYLVAKWTLDPLLRDRTALMVEKKEEAQDEDDLKDEPQLDNLLNPLGTDK